MLLLYSITHCLINVQQKSSFVLLDFFAIMCDNTDVNQVVWDLYFFMGERADLAKKQIFRKKTIEQLSEPEQLTGYLKVTGPGVWVALSGIIILLAGLLVWGFFGKLVSTVTVPAKIRDGLCMCYVLSEDAASTDEEIEVKIGDVKMTAELSKAERMTLDASADPDLYASGYLAPGRSVIVLSCRTDLKDGMYDALVTTETLKPISLIL